MNYLAHFHLARHRSADIKGALLGDFIKGPLRGQFDADTERGIELHRKIDAFSGSADELRAVSRQLSPELQRYAGIVLDVVFDYLLSHHWAQFHSEPLDRFAGAVYQVIEHHHRDWPAPARRFSRRLIDHDLLCRYGDWSTVDRVLGSIAARLRRENPLGRAAAAVEPQLDALEACFLDYYPRLQLYTETLVQQRDAMVRLQ